MLGGSLGVQNFLVLFIRAESFEMDGYGDGSSMQDSSKFQDLRPLGANPTGLT